MTTYLLSDLDGVLVDSTASVERAWRTWAAADDIAYATIEARMHGVPSKQTIAAVAPHLDAAAESAAVDSRQAAELRGADRIMESLAGLVNGSQFTAHGCAEEP